MCGIVGARRLDGGPVPEEVLRAMADQVEHRGPDGEGYWSVPGVGFGHRRLAIIDVGGSNQPMASPDGRLHVCFNGEILNYRELRGRLDHPWSTEGDTEVLLALFAAEGPQGVERLRGQFAYAVHDDRDGSLWLFRDRLGILPLYYARVGDALLFASEVKSLLVAMPGPVEVDETSLDDYLTRRAVPAPRTMYKGVRKLPPGHWLHLQADGRTTVHRYWSPPGPEELLDVTPAEAVDLVREGLDRAVARALVADVPVGSYLSGGVDSSLVVATVAGLRGAEGLHTFAAGFGDPRVDELHHARAVAEHLGTTHHEVVVRPDEFADAWSRLTWHRDAPLSEPADVAVHRLAELAGHHVKVVLSGEGSDELFGGYPKHRYAAAAERLGRIPLAVRGPVARGLDVALPSQLHRARIAARALGATDARGRDLGWFAPFTAAERRRLLGPRTPSVRPRSGASTGDPLDRMLRADLEVWLPDNLLERGDRMTMAASVELRPPFLDHELVETAFRLPSHLKVRDGTTKWLVKEVARGRLPSSIVDRPKAGFRVPLDAWFRSGMEDMARDRLLSPSSFVSQVMDRSAVRSVLDTHARGRRNEDIRIWTLLGLEVWHETCITATQRDRGSTAFPLSASSS